MMKRFFAASLAATALAGATPAFATTVINFDDLTGSGIVPDGYMGVNWNNDFYYADTPQPPYNPSSPNTRVVANYDYHTPGFPDSLTLDFLAPVTFKGLYTAGSEVGTVSFDLYRGIHLVGSSATIVATGTPFFLASGYGGIVDKVRINAVNGYSVYDDITFSAAPEPATWAVLLLGVGAIGFAMRRRAASTRAVPASYA